MSISQEFKEFSLNIADGLSVSMTMLYTFAGDFFDFMISDEGLQKVGLILTVIYLFLRVIYWMRKIWKQ